jgi:hypothetical protein
MTAAGVHRQAPGAAPAVAARPGRARGWLQLVWLYLVSRRIPAAAGLLAGFGALLWAALHWHWSVSGGPAAAIVIPLVIEAGAAAVIAVTTYGPFGEPERATGRWLPLLRLGATVALTAAAIGALAAGSTGGELPGGFVAMARNVAGITGIGLLCAVMLGGMLAWTGPMAYWVLVEAALADRLTTPWVWPARPPLDRGGAICAYLVFVTGLVLITVRGVRESVRDTST